MKRGFFGKLAESGIRAIVDRALGLREALPLGRTEEAGEAGPRGRPPRPEIATPPVDHPIIERGPDELRWQIPISAIERARALLAKEGVSGEATLQLAIIVLTADDEARIHRREESFSIEPRGRRALPIRPPGAKSLASIGLSTDGRFASIAHLTIDD